MYIRLQSNGAVCVRLRSLHMSKFLALAELEQAQVIENSSEQFSRMREGGQEESLFRLPGRNPLVLRHHRHGNTIDIDVFDAPHTGVPQPVRASWYQRILPHVSMVRVTLALLSLVVGVVGVVRHWP